MATEATFNFLQGVTFTRTFSYYTPGTPNVPVDLTNQSLRFEIADNDGFIKFTLDTDDGANTNGSIFEITDAANGLYSLTITAEDTARITNPIGTWWIGLNNGVEVRRTGHGPMTSARP
jgi:hypothetical protein